MGQKVNPISVRLGFIRDSDSKWFARHADFGNFLEEDFMIRKHIKNLLKQAAVAKVVIERVAGKLKIRIHSARPGVIIGRHGADIEKLTGELRGIAKNKEIIVDIEEIKNPAVNAQLVAENVAFQLEKRVAFRRAIKRSIDQAASAGAKGIKVCVAGRLGGAEIARTQVYKWGSVPLQTFRADIDYGFTEAHTRYGLIGCKVWIHKGDALIERLKETKKRQEETKKDGE
ncbi:MAG: 30S ribosomal protein S3 [Candidatus Omnitrophica bacterium CG1_02_44_16]|nr:MAG: 30S ribosomal protein S3 [Candidatus Omnitrophica bacterium CG1_02_44_16]PIY82820.1 MAG: 30S ribosomal protein S3 [Candidatus Omnitrophica bacterium CG_4_10_14_0_8_um_filter_44_12]PIZ84714.1 MAG: 30S ribosomal protein S3 [Candidatus Omnitrophica bacterium CG_4_10_14_0_2_um_filter_44_9]